MAQANFYTENILPWSRAIIKSSKDYYYERACDANESVWLDYANFKPINAVVFFKNIFN